MAAFRFKLEPLLKARKAAEREAQRQVAAVESERLRLENQLRTQQEIIGRGKNELQTQLVGPVDVQMLRLHAAASMHAMRQGHRLVLELAGVHRRLETVRAHLVHAAQQRRTIEIVREKRLQAWQAEQNKIEDQFIDELAVTAAARSDSEEL